jgi:asparagine synthase (glutamine-hydrolysing)
MCDAIRHRGPDDDGYFVDGAVGIGMRRLSIVDVAGGHQPMTNEDGTAHIVYNGEIYNHADYREELEARGHRYRTHCDTETILHLYEEHGPACVRALRGMFAFAVWDATKRELFVARDRLGVKPLYYVHDAAGSLFFGSEIKTLLEAGAVKPEINFAALPDYLANHAPSGEETLFSGVKRLPPGHTLRWRDGEIRIERYWDVHFAEAGGAHGLPRKSDDDYVAEWSELFRESVRLRLMADVPLGMFLSGGIDSSAIAATMSRMVDAPIKTFSVAFAEREANELEYARIVARAFKTDHHEVVVSPEEFWGALPELIWHEDEPLAHPSSVALYFVSLLASRHVKVVLTGEGSDELLAGYDRYRKTVFNLALGARYHSAVPDALRRAVAGAVEALPVASRARHKLRRTFLSLTPDIETIYFDNFAVFPRAMQRGLLTPEVQARAGTADPYARVSRYLRETDAETLLGRLLYADIKTYLHELLMKQDQMSMAASIESRVPFLDHKLVEFAMGLPRGMKVRGASGKHILKRALEEVLPRELLNRRKRGFGAPIREWLREGSTDLLDAHVLNSPMRRREFFDYEHVARLVDEHRRGARDRSFHLWTLLNLSAWYERWIDGA